MARRLVVKVGSSSLTSPDGRLDIGRLVALTNAISARYRDSSVVLVSSGAIAAGMGPLGLRRRPKDLATQQAAASVGQGALVAAYQQAFGAHGVTVGQVLLTIDDVTRRSHYLNARRTLERLLELRVLPVINENDTVATQEIRYGDNDRLGARVAEMTSSDVLVLLSDVDGLYDGDPTLNAGATLIPEVRELTPAIEALAGASATEYGSGGMVTKLVAARICMNAGCATVIASGRRLHPLQAIEDGAACTWFLPGRTPRQARKQWIAGTLVPRGTLHIDAGAERALRGGSSLLPVGVLEVSGEFQAGDAVVVRGAGGRDLARGLVACSSEEARRIRGRRSEELAGLLGYSAREEMIHRDNLALLDN